MIKQDVKTNMHEYDLSKFNDEYLTFPQTAARFPIFSEGALRWHRFNNTGGFNRCVRRIGRKCVISLRDFIDWLNEQKDPTTNHNTIQ